MCKVNLVNCSLFPAAAGVCVLKAHYSYIHIRSKQKKEEDQLRLRILQQQVIGISRYRYVRTPRCILDSSNRIRYAPIRSRKARTKNRAA